MPNDNLKETGEILLQQKKFMRKFMENYMLNQLGLSLQDDFTAKHNYLRIIDFCLHTRQRIRNDELKQGKNYFRKKYKNFIKYYNENNIAELKELIYSCPGVGQKIGSLILEVFIHYKGGKEEVEEQLYLPIDIHTKRVLEDSFQINVPRIGIKTTASSFLEFQELLSSHAPIESGRIIFDYLWFVGKVFCQKVNSESDTYSRGFRLCHICWLNKTCQHFERWLY